MKTIDNISGHIKMRDVEDENTENLLEKIDSLYSELRHNFENNLQRIKDSNYLISYDSNYNSEVKDRKHSNELEQELINDVEIEEIIDQKDYVNDRQQNMIDLDNALSSIHNMSEYTWVTYQPLPTTLVSAPVSKMSLL